MKEQKHSNKDSHKTSDKAELFTGVLNRVEYIYTRRPNGTLRVQQDFSACPSLAEQHTAHLTDINYLISKYKPDELAAYIAARGAHKQEIRGHDFSQEPNLQEANNIVYRLKRNFEALPEEIKMNFKNHLEFLKFIDNPANQEKMIKLGLMTPQEIKKVTTDEVTPTPTKEKETEPKTT